MALLTSHPNITGNGPTRTRQAICFVTKSFRATDRTITGKNIHIKMKTNLHFRIFLLLLVMGFNAMAQNTIKELAALDDKTFWKGAKFVNMAGSSGKPYKNGQGVRAYYPALKVPKKIAVVSFYCYDLGTTESVSFGNYRAFGWASTKSTTWNMTQEATSKVTNMFYAYWMETQKENMLKYCGAELITPDQFTAEQKNVYKNFQLDKSKVGSTIMAGKETSASTLEFADGYEPILVFAPGDYKMAESLGLLAKDLNVDAVLVVVTEMRTDKKGSHVSAVGMYMYGPNPVPRREDVKYIGFNGAGRQEGNVYEAQKVAFNGDEGVLFYSVNKKTKQVDYFDFEGLDAVYGKVLGGLWYQLVTVKKCGQAD